MHQQRCERPPVRAPCPSNPHLHAVLRECLWHSVAASVSIAHAAAQARPEMGAARCKGGGSEEE